MADVDESQLEAMRAIRPQLIDLRIPLLADGMSRDLLCEGENSTFRIHCYATGLGEKHGFHAHVEEEHLFVVLMGQAVFSSLDGRLEPLGPNRGIWLPKGCFYEFFNPGPEPLVVLRFGAQASGLGKMSRVTPEGEPIRGRGSSDPEAARPKILDGQVFG